MIRVYKTDNAIVIEQDNNCFISKETNWDQFINRDGLYQKILLELKKLKPVGDSNWLEPELTLVVTSSGKIVGYSIGNDMSSRSIEGENPLYLPQAKMYDGSASIGPCVLVMEKTISPDTGIAINIDRDGKTVFEGSTTIDRMKRRHEELVEFLFREYSCPVGCYLMTGTCVVPENDFTLYSGDVITIRIDNIGELVNIVA